MQTVVCPECGKKVKNLKAHTKYSHPKKEEEQQMSDEELHIPTEEIKSSFGNKVPVPVIEEPKETPSEGDKLKGIVDILYEDVVRVICDESNIACQEWNAMLPEQKQMYFTIAKKIIKAVIG